MLKRQRPSTPPPHLPETQVEDPSDLYEPDSKRRKYFARPLPYGSNQATSMSDGEDSEDGDGASSSARGRLADRRREWHEAAGQYKEANILLHDLHAEYRHRMIFASPHDHAPSHLSYRWTEENSEGVGGKNVNDADANRIHAEAETVSQRYEDSNRFLRSLVLSRRQQSSS